MAPSGVLLIDKPVGPTSHDVVDMIRRAYNVRRVGHTGTLDPGASGLLLVLIERATRVAAFLTGLDKTYLATINFGVTSDTGDGQGNLTPSGDASGLTENRVREIIHGLTALSSHEVPAYSAVRTEGRHRYSMARAGEEVPPMERSVIIHESELVAFTAETAIAKIRCSAGTYIRSLAEHAGREAGCGAYLAALRRERIGQWDVRNAHAPEIFHPESASGRLPTPAPMEEYLPFPKVVLSVDATTGVRHGKPIFRRHVTEIRGGMKRGELVVLTSTHGRPVAIAEALIDGSDLPSCTPAQEVCRYRRVLIQ